MAGLPLDQALRVSTLAEQSGQGGFILDYLTRYGSDPDAVSGLAEASPEALNLYAKQVSAPNSLLRQVAPEKGLRLTNGEVVSVDPNLASALARQLSANTGKDAWGSAATGKMYLPVSSARAWTAGEQLIDILRQSPDKINGSNAQALMQVIGKESVRGSGDCFQMGPFTPNSAVDLPPELTGVERGVYI